MNIGNARWGRGGGVAVEEGAALFVLGADSPMMDSGGPMINSGSPQIYEAVGPAAMVVEEVDGVGGA